MIQPVDTILALVLLSVLISFGSSRLPALIKVVAFQGVVVSIVPFFIGHGLTTGGVVFTLATLLIRGIAIPVFIYLAIKKTAIHREVEPIVGYHASLMAGLVLMVAATFVSPKFNLPQTAGIALLLPTAITLLAAGMAAQAVFYLEAAGVLPPLGGAVWDTSWLLPQSSIPGLVLHTLVGYNDRPSAMQLVAYAGTIAAMAALMRAAAPRREPFAAAT